MPGRFYRHPGSPRPNQGGYVDSAGSSDGSFPGSLFPAGSGPAASPGIRRWPKPGGRIRSSIPALQGGSFGRSRGYKGGVGVRWAFDHPPPLFGPHRRPGCGFRSNAGLCPGNCGWESGCRDSRRGTPRALQRPGAGGGPQEGRRLVGDVPARSSRRSVNDGKNTFIESQKAMVRKNEMKKDEEKVVQGEEPGADDTTAAGGYPGDRGASRGRKPGRSSRRSDP